MAVGGARALYVGRFQPFHRGHLALIAGIRAADPARPVLIAVGSAELSYRPENPFTGGERIEMILRSVEEAGLAGAVQIYPVPDIHRHHLWVGYLHGLLPGFDRVYTNNPLTRMLFEAAGETVRELPWIDREHLCGARIREEMRAEPPGPWADRVPPAVARYLTEIDAPTRLRRIAAAPVVPGSVTGG